MMKASAFNYIRALPVGLMFLATSAHATSLAADAEVVATGLHFPEGAIFVGETLYFVDYATSRVMRMVRGKVEYIPHPWTL
jgi:sugar lactone lactonase YvrE